MIRRGRGRESRRQSRAYPAAPPKNMRRRNYGDYGTRPVTERRSRACGGSPQSGRPHGAWPRETGNGRALRLWGPLGAYPPPTRQGAPRGIAPFFKRVPKVPKGGAPYLCFPGQTRRSEVTKRGNNRRQQLTQPGYPTDAPGQAPGVCPSPSSRATPQA